MGRLSHSRVEAKCTRERECLKEVLLRRIKKEGVGVEALRGTATPVASATTPVSASVRKSRASLLLRIPHGQGFDLLTDLAHPHSRTLLT